jgi:hypothetical protein
MLFHNIQVPLDEKGRIVYPVDTDELIPQVCYTTRVTIMTFEDHSVVLVLNVYNTKHTTLRTKRPTNHDNIKLDSWILCLVFIIL